MTFSDDCPCGRSQDLTFAESSGKFSVDRQTFERLILLVEWCAKELVIYRYRDCNTFLASLNTYLSSDSAEVIESFEVRKSFLLLNHYCDSIPKALDEVDNRLEEARLVLNSISTVNTSFRGRQ
jgi:hypothetical protein